MALITIIYTYIYQYMYTIYIHIYMIKYITHKRGVGWSDIAYLAIAKKDFALGS